LALLETIVRETCIGSVVVNDVSMAADRGERNHLCATCETVHCTGFLGTSAPNLEGGRGGKHRGIKNAPLMGACYNRSKIYLPVRIFVNTCPEKMFFICGGKKHSVPFDLFYHAFIIVLHQISKTVFCFFRYRRDKCSFHDSGIQRSSVIIHPTSNGIKNLENLFTSFALRKKRNRKFFGHECVK